MTASPRDPAAAADSPGTGDDAPDAGGGRAPRGRRAGVRRASEGVRDLADRTAAGMARRPIVRPAGWSLGFLRGPSCPRRGSADPIRQRAGRSPGTDIAPLVSTERTVLETPRMPPLSAVVVR